MKRRTVSWRLLIICIGAAALAFTSSCAKPGKSTESAMQLDQVQMLETAAQPAEEGDSALRQRLGAPERFVYEAQSGVWRICADAVVVVPDADALPMVRTSGGDFTQRQVDAALNALWGDAPMWNADPPLTKREIDSEIASIREHLASDPEYQDERAYFEEIRLPELARMRMSAPDTAAAQRSDGTLEPEPVKAAKTERVLASRTVLTLNGDDGRCFSVRNNYDIEQALENTRNGRLIPQKWATMRYAASGPDAGNALRIGGYRASGPRVDPMGDTPPQEGAPSPRQAAETVRAFLTSIGADMDIYDMALMENASPPVYRVRCVRDVLGVPCLIMEHGASATEFSGQDEELAGSAWAYEAMTLYVGQAGIVNMEWTSPHFPGETLVESSALLPFSDVEGVFTSIMPVILDGEWGHLEGVTEAALAVTRVELGMCRILENRSIDSGLFIPAWAFYGTQSIVSASGSTASDPREMRLLLVNAVDGSVIDPDKGY